MTRSLTHVGIGLHPTPLPPVAIGEIVDGRYRVEEVIGAGGMGVVVRATHVELESTVALKFLLPELVENEDARRRLFREARAAARLRSKHLARVLDVGTLESGVPYIVMEYLDGWDLAAVLRERPRLAIGEVVGCILQMCEALSEAHGAGIVHRDLKPENVFLTHDEDGAPCVKVLDFGISKYLPPPGSRATRETVTLIGSPLYMSPEQMTAPSQIDARADIWGLGVLIYEMLAGRSPFDGETLPQICAFVLREPPWPLRDLRPDVPPALEAVVSRCLAKSRDDRFATVAELVEAIECAVAVGIDPRPRVVSELDGVDEDVVWWEDKLRGRGGWVGRALVALVAFVLLGSGVGLALLDPARRLDVLAWRPGRPFPALRRAPSTDDGPTSLAPPTALAPERPQPDPARSAAGVPSAPEPSASARSVPATPTGVPSTPVAKKAAAPRAAPRRAPPRAMPSVKPTPSAPRVMEPDITPPSFDPTPPQPPPKAGDLPSVVLPPDRPGVTHDPDPE